MSQRVVRQLQQEAIPVNRSCQLLGISRAGYYAAQQRAHHVPAVCALSVQIKAVFQASGGIYGSRRVRAALQAQGLWIGRYRIRQLMRQHGLRPKWQRKFVHTTDSKHDLPLADNLLNRQFAPAAANQAWVADITYIRTRQGWLYLAVVLDLFSRKVVGWAMAPSMPASLVCAALQMALAHRQSAAGLMMHSDRGSQYASTEYQALLKRHGSFAEVLTALPARPAAGRRAGPARRRRPRAAAPRLVRRKQAPGGPHRRGESQSEGQRYILDAHETPVIQGMTQLQSPCLSGGDWPPSDSHPGLRGRSRALGRGIRRRRGDPRCPRR